MKNKFLNSTITIQDKQTNNIFPPIVIDIQGSVKNNIFKIEHKVLSEGQKDRSFQDQAIMHILTENLPKVLIDLTSITLEELIEDYDKK